MFWRFFGDGSAATVLQLRYLEFDDVKCLLTNIWGVSSLFKRKNILGKHSQNLSHCTIFMRNTQLLYDWQNLDLFVLNCHALKREDWKRLMHLNLVLYWTANISKIFIMVTSLILRQNMADAYLRSTLVLSRGPTCINHPWSTLQKVY